jgi:putative spermidine/putrescine transport system ATP-binding protein
VATIEMTGVRKQFGTTLALSDLHLSIGSGELVCLLGPSGCGKTTALRLLAGFETPDAGRILVDGADVTRVSPRRRGFGMVFQEYSLFPHLTARANIAFGLRMQRRSGAYVTETVDRLLAMTRLEQHADKYPHQMSGGQKQRVALARAVATEPRLLLLDEPLSALDALVREHLRGEIRRLQRELGVTTVFVTHDQHEAMAVADRVAVMHDGALEQIAPPRVLYSRPATPFVAGFVGTVNRVTAERGAGQVWRVLGSAVPVAGDEPSEPAARAVVRPEQLVLSRSQAAGAARVAEVAFLGALTRVTLEHPAEGPLTADLLGEAADGWRVGDLADVTVRPGSGAVVLV